MLTELTKDALFCKEYAQHERARCENQPLLEKRLNELRAGSAIDALEPFAKAYLGMFYDIDNNIAPEARIYLLVDKTFVEPIISGLKTALQQQVFSAPDKIADSLVNDERLTLGYIALAGLDLFLQQGGKATQLSPDTIKSIICFHYANSTYHHDDWLMPLIKSSPDLAVEAYTEFWQALRGKGYAYLPGLQMILENDELIDVRRNVIVTAAALMRNKRPKELAKMLLVALKDEPDELFDTCCEILQHTDEIGIRQQVYWQALAFILEPAVRTSILSAFVGQEKIKILPLLDFINWVLVENEERLSGEAIGELIRIIAPKFTPQMDSYGELSDISQKVAWLFYLLGTRITLPALQLTKKLRRVRVLKLYSEVFDEVESLQQQLATGELKQAPDSDSFIQMLHESGKLKSKKKWSDTNV